MSFGFSAFAASPAQFIYVCRKPELSTKVYQVTITRAAASTGLNINVVDTVKSFSKSEEAHHISVGAYGVGTNYVSASFKLNISSTAPLINIEGKLYSPSFLQTKTGATVSLLCEKR